ncbi:MAG TPA: hypothetical protein VMT67_10725 [Terriglobales bacterium]|nr:hypothetical protein [Terriglobales bacterium]
MTVVFLLAVIAILLYLRRPNRDYTLGAAVLIAALTWLAIDVHLLRMLQEVFAFAMENWVDVVMALGALVLLIVPAVMIYIGVRDELDKRALVGHPRDPLTPACKAVSSNPRNRVLDKFEQRVATLTALGYGRTEAETTAFHQMKRDLDRGTSRSHHPRRT